MNQGVEDKNGGFYVTRAELEAWAKKNLPKGYEKDWLEAILAFINHGPCNGIDYEDLWSMRHDVLKLQVLLDVVKFFVYWMLTSCNQDDLQRFRRMAREMQRARQIADGSVNEQGLILAIYKDGNADISAFVHPERAKFDSLTVGLKPRRQSSGDDRLKFRLLLTPYAKLIEELVEADMTGMRGAPKELDRERDRIRPTKRKAVNRAWNAVIESVENTLDKPVLWYFLALQFCLYRYVEQKDSRLPAEQKT